MSVILKLDMYLIVLCLKLVWKEIVPGSMEQRWNRCRCPCSQHTPEKHFKNIYFSFKLIFFQFFQVQQLSVNLSFRFHNKILIFFIYKQVLKFVSFHADRKHFFRINSPIFGLVPIVTISMNQNVFYTVSSLNIIVRFNFKAN